DTAHLGREQRGVAVHRHDVAVLHDAPKPAAVGMLLPGDGRLPPQARKDLVLLAALEHVEIEQVQIHAITPPGDVSCPRRGSHGTTLTSGHPRVARGLRQAHDDTLPPGLQISQQRLSRCDSMKYAILAAMCCNATVINVGFCNGSRTP